MFVDESKVRGYTMAAVVCSDAQASRGRRELNALRMKGQKRIHFVRESDSRRRLVLSTLTQLDIHAHLYRAEGLGVHPARDLCLKAIVDDAVRLGVGRIVLESDETTVRHDTDVLHRATHDDVGIRSVDYGHEQASAEPLLWAADAIVWSYTKGGDWLRRVTPMVAATRLLLP